MDIAKTTQMTRNGLDPTSALPGADIPQGQFMTHLGHAMLLVPGHENGSVLQTTAKQGVRANAVGYAGAVSPSTGKSSGQTREDLERRAAKMCLLGRRTDAREVAYPILWRASGEASYVTGSVPMVDGGQLAK